MIRLPDALRTGWPRTGSHRMGRLWAAWWWLGAAGLAGCPWVSPAQHRENLDQLGDDDDTTPTGTTGHTSDTATTPECPEDDREDDDDVASAAFTDGTDLPGTVCPGDPGDHAVLTLARNQSLLAEVGGACTPDAVLRVYRDGVPVGVAAGACPTLQLGLGPGEYTAGIASPSGEALSYVLTLHDQPCEDTDTDGQPPVSCGGSDCDDSTHLVAVGAFDEAGDGVDADCDGGDDLARKVGACSARVQGGPDPVELPCGDPDWERVWDTWVLTGLERDTEIEVFVSPVEGETGDLFAWVVDADGARFGLDPSHDELDDEDVCLDNVAPCPGACLDGVHGPRVEVHVAQRTCTGPVNYSLRVGSRNWLPTAATVSRTSGNPPPAR